MNSKFEIDINFTLGTEDFFSKETIKNFIFKVEYGIIKMYRGKRVFWPHFWIKILGFNFGVAYFTELKNNIDK